MKKFLIISGMVFWALILVGGAWLGVSMIIGIRLDTSSKAYVDKNVPIILSTWSEQEMFKCASSEFKEAVSNPDKQASFDQTWAGFVKLGALKKYEGSQGQSFQNASYFSHHNGYKVYAKYVAYADFQNGGAKIDVELIRENDDWKIYYFSVKRN